MMAYVFPIHHRNTHTIYNDGICMDTHPYPTRHKNKLRSVGAGRSTRRQMRRYLPCGERFVLSLATVAKTKIRSFHKTYES